jgi:hypothetical protein
MSWYRTGRVVVTNGSKTVTGVGTLFTTAVNVGDAFALVDANLNPTGAWYEVEAVVSNTEITLKQSYAGTTGGNNQYCVFNMVGNMTTPSFAQRLATFFASFQSLIDKPTTTPTAASIPIADENGDIDSGWLKDASATVKGVVKVGTNLGVVDGVISVPDTSTTAKGVVELATSVEVLAGTDDERAVSPASLKSIVDVEGGLASTDYADGKITQTITEGVEDKAPSEGAVFDALALKAPLASPTFTGDVVVPDQTAGNNSTKAANTKYVDAGLGLKANITDVDDALALKANVTDVTDALALKADVTYAEYLMMEGDPA